MTYRIKTSSSGNAVVGIVVIIFWAIFAIGWVWNIIKFVGHFADPLSALEVLRGIGIAVVPLGVVLGYFF